MGNPWAPVIDTGLEFGCFFARHVSAKSSVKNPESMGDLQDPIDGGTLVPYVWSYFVVIFTCIGLKNRPYIYGRYLHFRILKFPLTESVTHFREKLLETLHFQAPQLPWVVLPSHWSTVKKHGNWTNDFVKEYDWQIWTEFDQWEGWCRDRWFIINLSYFSVFIQNIHQFCQGKMRRSSFWTRGFAALKRCSPIFLDKHVWLRSLNKPCYVHMHRCDTLIHVHEEEYEMIWMNIYICHAAKLQTCSGDQKNPWHVVFDSQRKPKKKCWPSDGIRTRQEAQLGHGQVGSRNGWVIFLSRELIKS